MKKQAAILVGLGMAVLIVLCVFNSLVVTDVIKQWQSHAPLPGSVPAARPEQTVRIATPGLSATTIAKPTATPTSMPILVTDPKAVALTPDDLPLGFRLDQAHTRYVDNQKLVEESHDPHSMAANIEATGRLNGYEIVFTTDDPAVMNRHASVIINLIQVYNTSDGARQAFDMGLESRLPGGWGELAAMTEATTAQIGDRTRAYKGLVVTEIGTKNPAGVLAFQCSNVLVTFIVLGPRDYYLLDEAIRHAQIINKRIQRFGHGQIT